MRELLFNGFVERMKFQLSKPMTDSEFLDLYKNLEKFIRKFPDRKEQIENEFLGNMILENYFLYFEMLKNKNANLPG